MFIMGASKFPAVVTPKPPILESFQNYAYHNDVRVKKPQINQELFVMWGVHTKHWFVTGWLVIITSHVNRDSAYFPSPIPCMDSHLIWFFCTKFLQIPGCKYPTGRWVEFSHSQGRFWSNWAKSFWCGHSFLNSTNWQSGWAEHLEMWMPRVLLRSLSLSLLIQEHWITPFQTETEETQTRNIKGNK